MGPHGRDPVEDQIVLGSPRTSPREASAGRLEDGAACFATQVGNGVDSLARGIPIPLEVLIRMQRVVSRMRGLA